MRPQIALISAVLCTSAWASLGGCNSDKPKADTHVAASAEPIPSDLVYNGFMDDKNGKPNIVMPLDAGGPVTNAAPSNVKLENAGADPKSPLVYAFANKARAVNATLKISQTGGPQQGQGDQSFRLQFTATPKPKFGVNGDATIDIKVTKLEIPLPANAPPQAAAGKDAMEKAFIGLAGHLDATTHGDMSEAQFESDKQGANEIIGLLQQTLELLIVPLPNDAVGVGAKWTKSESKTLADEGTSMKLNTSLTLLARDAQTATIKVDVSSSGIAPVNDPRAPKGTMLQRTNTASYTIVARLDGVAQKIDGENKLDVVQKIPGQPDQAITVKVVENVDSK